MLDREKTPTPGDSRNEKWNVQNINREKDPAIDRFIFIFQFHLCLLQIQRWNKICQNQFARKQTAWNCSPARRCWGHLLQVDCTHFAAKKPSMPMFSSGFPPSENVSNSWFSDLSCQQSQSLLWKLQKYLSLFLVSQEPPSSLCVIYIFGERTTDEKERYDHQWGIRSCQFFHQHVQSQSVFVFQGRSIISRQICLGSWL